MNSLQSIVEALAGELGVNVYCLYQLADCDSLKMTASYGLSQSAIAAKIHIHQGLTGRKLIEVLSSRNLKPAV